MKYEQWLKQIVINVVEINQLTSHSARAMYEKIVRNLLGEKRNTNEREN